MYLVGSIAALGNWNPANAVAMSASGYSSADPVWAVTVAGLTPGVAFAYKYVKRNADGSVVWESDPNRGFTVPCAGTAVVSDTWR